MDREASLAAGMNAHLTKPIDENRLYETLLAVLRRHDAGASRTASVTSPAAHDAAAGLISGAPPDGLPALLPGIDLDTALERLGGRRALLLRLLRGFARDFADAPARLAEADRTGRRDDIAMLAHTVKSAAAYLGADALADAAERLEESARRGDDEAMAERVLLFGGYLDAVLGALRDAASGDHAGPAGAAAAFANRPERLDPAGPPDGLAIVGLIERAEPLVAGGDYTALAILEEIGARLAGTPLAPLADTIRNQFEEIELEAASASLQRLRTLVTGDRPS